ncbi:uncharacterized protein LOC132181902 [Corylus avellana]|uniref:uncharacterized protein LOC132181902 n=1 Tax=Corylus avellana TaxID=13451 RepID=UPI00286CC9ED|nr:uncharacterized protein LOC132181902 [Corylus avellana]
MEDFKAANFSKNPNANSGERVTARTSWVAPPRGWLKANWDAALNRPKGVMGLGIVVRDSEGRVRAARSNTRRGLLDPTVAEAVAAYQAVLFCNELGYTHIILEGDAKNIVDVVKDNGCNRSRMGQMIDDIRTTLCYLTDWKIEYVSRRNNSAAHRLAKEATTDIIDRNWLEKTPECICDIILMEKSSSSVI